MVSMPAPVAAALGMGPDPVGTPSGDVKRPNQRLGSSRASLASAGSAAAAFRADADAACNLDRRHTRTAPLASPNATSACAVLVLASGICWTSMQLMDNCIPPARNPVGLGVACGHMSESCCCCAWYQVLRDGGLSQPNCLASNCWQWLEDLHVDNLWSCQDYTVLGFNQFGWHMWLIGTSHAVGRCC